MNYSLIGRKLCKVYPHLAFELMTVPDLKDLNMIQDLYKEYCSIQSAAKDKNGRVYLSLIFIAAVIRLYDPDWFAYGKSVRKGLRIELASVLGCEGSLISHNLTNVKNFMRIYSDFRNEVSYVYGQLKVYASGTDQNTSEVDGKTEEVL